MKKELREGRQHAGMRYWNLQGINFRTKRGE